LPKIWLVTDQRSQVILRSQYMASPDHSEGLAKMSDLGHKRRSKDR
jgi:hypothetical protein